MSIFSTAWRIRTNYAGCCIWLALSFVCLPLMGCVEKAFYYPDQLAYGSPADQGLPFETVSFQSKDGTLLSGWFVPAQGFSRPQDAKGTVIHFHGNAENMSSHWLLVSWLPQRGFNVFVFDYRGYGQSHGSPEPKGVFEDANSAIDYVRQRPDIDPLRLLVFGQSLGGTNAIAAVGAGNRSGVKAVAIEATFYSYSTIANQTLPGAGLLVSDQYSAERYIAKLAPIPLLLLHGTADEVIPYDHAKMLLQQAQPPKTLITVPGGGHIEAMTARFGTTYQDALVRFFEAALADQP
ncbi:alpha/beta hydrolase [Uliginosibacterium gangwonense]|uniref:alpha/beta hydrolase n=1 Tax=Uliginosibacterium gangwonense TaxID=392736 RepID=UPI00035E7F0D|nr:alpha/beta hydrolase [Uliginosibacterium gangwonense]